MRLLADNPSMEFLRREAKDLLPALRQSDSAATLADAQRAIAEDYGFRTWADLKAEVERRRADVPEAPQGLAEGVAAAFGLGEVTAPMTPIRYEYMGRRWTLECTSGRFIVYPVFDWIDDQQAEVAVDLQERARAAGVRSPVSVRTADGGLVRRVLDQSWRVHEWMDLGPMPVEPVAASLTRSAGRVLAAVHEVAPKTDRPMQGPWVNAADRPTAAAWGELLDRTHAAGCGWADELAGLSPTIQELSAIADDAPQESLVITNCDLGVGCVRVGEGDELVVLHWDFAGPMVPEWELATTLLHWTQFGANAEAGRALLVGYRERRGAAPSLTLGSFTPGITGWLTWVLHRAWEAACLDPSPQREFAERSVRETLDEPLTVAKLEAILQSAR